jgi:hypothetical protein
MLRQRPGKSLTDYVHFMRQTFDDYNETCVLVIDHHTHYMWVRFLKSKDDNCSEMETILLDIRHLHARHHSHSGAFAPVIKFDSDYVSEVVVTRQMCARMGIGVQLSAPYAHHMLGKAERP